MGVCFSRQDQQDGLPKRLYRTNNPGNGKTSLYSHQNTMLKTNEKGRRVAPDATSTGTSINQGKRKRKSHRHGQTSKKTQEELMAIHMRLDYARAQYATAIDAMEYWEREIFMIYNRMNGQKEEAED
ncbi:hypothetical protein FBEOM_5166 [Fusarium beomiforme]|uniref:Uncharacterized protein n=1 Tax=Fusarium beomiforme TaxID=44412 RepID=A0A9P5DZV7_9HYPO|nr:hypothetical protein FBEOM_5166 [Fusarium beomiforme]